MTDTEIRGLSAVSCDATTAEARRPSREPARERWPFLETEARLFKALSDETRLGIVLQLREDGEVCQCDFSACCTVLQPTVSHHLKILREAGIVLAEKRGVWVYYRLSPAALEGLRRYLA
ncbi:MAG: metalloregulator ArsR/SmtB family transcription factor [Chloroflexi bacterium]|nr:metalloregulator ArsR/SmtB family transcription factor [Chloroflexota bacterium]